MQVFMAINILMEKLEKSNKDLDSMMNKKRVTNPIIGNVLAIAAKAMGLPKHDKDYNDNDEFGSDLLKFVAFKLNYLVIYDVNAILFQVIRSGHTILF